MINITNEHHNESLNNLEARWSRPAISQATTRPIVSQMTGVQTQTRPAIRSDNTITASQAQTRSTIRSARPITTITPQVSLGSVRPTTTTSQVSQTQIRPTTAISTATHQTSSTTAALMNSTTVDSLQQTRVQEYLNDLDLSDINSNNSYMHSSEGFDSDWYRANTTDQFHQNLNSNWYQIDTADQFRQDLLRSLRTKYHIDEFDTLTHHIEEEHYFEYLLNWGLSAILVDILKKPIIVIEE